MRLNIEREVAINEADKARKINGQLQTATAPSLNRRSVSKDLSDYMPGPERKKLRNF